MATTYPPPPPPLCLTRPVTLCTFRPNLLGVWLDLHCSRFATPLAPSHPHDTHTTSHQLSPHNPCLPVSSHAPYRPLPIPSPFNNAHPLELCRPPPSNISTMTLALTTPSAHPSIPALAPLQVCRAGNSSTATTRTAYLPSLACMFPQLPAWSVCMMLVATPWLDCYHLCFLTWGGPVGGEGRFTIEPESFPSPTPTTSPTALNTHTATQLPTVDGTHTCLPDLQPPSGLPLVEARLPPAARLATQLSRLGDRCGKLLWAAGQHNITRHKETNY